MGIFSRLTDIVNSNLSALLDRAEEPEKMIRFIIQEMEDTLVEVRTTAARTIADKKESGRKLSRLESAQAEWQRKAELALSKGREDLAKGALVEKARLEETARSLTEELSQIDEVLVQHDDDVAKLQSKLAEAKAKQKSFQTRHATATSQLRVRRQLFDKRIEESFARFEQVEKKLDEVEGEVEAYDLGRRRSLVEEFSDLEAADAIEDELTALKKRLAKSGSSEGQS